MQKNVADIEGDIQMMHDFADETIWRLNEPSGWDKKGLKILERLEKFNIRQKRTAAERRAKKTRLLSLYRAEAEAQRSKALRRWI